MKKLAAALLGGILTLGGIALLVLPGPGFLLIAAGLAVLATQFAWAQRPLAYAQDKAKQGVREVQKSWWRFALAAIAAAALMTIGVLDLTGLDVPFVNILSAVVLILSGLALVATLVYSKLRTTQF